MIHPSARLLCAVILLCIGAPAWAAPGADQAPETRGLYLQLIGQARDDGRARAALAYLDDFNRRYPGDVEASILRINSLLDLGEIEEAQAIASALAAEGNSGLLSATRGHIMMARGQWGEAIPLYRAALRAMPADALLRNALGYAQLRAGQTAAAVETLRAAADLAPGEAVIRNNLVLALTMNGQSAQALALLETVPDASAQKTLSSQVIAEAARIKALSGQSARRGD